MRMRMAHPVGVEADVGNADVSAEGSVEGFAVDDFFDRRRAILGVQIEVEGLFPLRRQEDEVARLAHVFLGDLQLDGFVGFVEAGEERRNGLADLEIDGAVFDLDDDVVGELAVEGMEDVVGGAGAVGFDVVPVEMMVVDEGAVEDDAAVGLERRGEHVGGVDGRAAVFARDRAGLRNRP